MKELLIVSLGSFVGGGLRYLVGRLIGTWVSMPFPWATLTVNVVGCFFIGLLSGWAMGGHLSPNVKLLLVTGCCGGFTTFSTFMNENFLLGRDGQMLTAFCYTAVSLLLGLGAVALGYLCSK